MYVFQTCTSLYLPIVVAPSSLPLYLFPHPRPSDSTFSLVKFFKLKLRRPSMVMRLRFLVRKMVLWWLFCAVSDIPFSTCMFSLFIFILQISSYFWDEGNTSSYFTSFVYVLEINRVTLNKWYQSLQRACYNTLNQTWKNLMLK